MIKVENNPNMAWIVVAGTLCLVGIAASFSIPKKPPTEAQLIKADIDDCMRAAKANRMEPPGALTVGDFCALYGIAKSAERKCRVDPRFC